MPDSVVDLLKEPSEMTVPERVAIFDHIYRLQRKARNDDEKADMLTFEIRSIINSAGEIVNRLPRELVDDEEDYSHLYEPDKGSPGKEKSGGSKESGKKKDKGKERSRKKKKKQSRNESEREMEENQGKGAEKGKEKGKGKESRKKDRNDPPIDKARQIIKKSHEEKAKRRSPIPETDSEEETSSSPLPIPPIRKRNRITLPPLPPVKNRSRSMQLEPLSPRRKVTFAQGDRTSDHSESRDSSKKPSDKSPSKDEQQSDQDHDHQLSDKQASTSFDGVRTRHQREVQRTRTASPILQSISSALRTPTRQRTTRGAQKLEGTVPPETPRQLRNRQPLITPSKPEKRGAKRKAVEEVKTPNKRAKANPTPQKKGKQGRGGRKR
jgi:hypothetical protein